MAEEMAVRMVEPRPQPAIVDADRAWTERVRRDQERIESWNRRHVDKIGVLLGSTFVRHNETWPWLRDRRGASLSCSRFYPAVNVAVDIFPVIGPAEEAEIADKREVFGAAGIRYGALSHAMELVDLIPQVGLS